MEARPERVPADAFGGEKKARLPWSVSLLHSTAGFCSKEKDICLVPHLWRSSQELVRGTFAGSPVGVCGLCQAVFSLR